MVDILSKFSDCSVAVLFEIHIQAFCAVLITWSYSVHEDTLVERLISSQAVSETSNCDRMHHTRQCT